jgi:hypothetical protein
MKKMIGKHLAKLPWPTRLLIGLPLGLLLTWIALRLLAASMMDNFADADPDNNEISYDSSFFELNGNVGARNLRIDHYLPDGTVGASFAADRMVVHTPGLHWLWWTAMRGSKNIPGEIGVTLENFRDLSRAADTPGNYTNLPYDQVGCGKDLLTPARLRDMGLADVRRDVSLRLLEKDADTSVLSLDLLTHDASELSLDLDLRIPRPIKWRDTLAAFSEASVTSAQMRLRDHGFVAMRNAYCAKTAGLDAAAFRAYLARALDARLDEVGFRFNADALARYKQFSAEGGELLFVARRPPTQELTKFATADLSRQIQMMPAVVSYNGGQEVPFHLDVRLPGEIRTAPAAVTPAQAIAATTPASAPAPAPATIPAAEVSSAPATPVAPLANASPAPVLDARPKPAPTPVALPAGELGYKDLKDRIGAHVEILTHNGTVRRGRLMAYSAYLSTLKLDPEQGGFVLTVPGASVASVRALSAEAVATNAGANAVAAPTP